VISWRHALLRPVCRRHATSASDLGALQRQVLKEHGTRALLHSPPQGIEALRQAIAAYVNLERGARATPERVLVLTSSQQALTLCANVLLDAGERIFIEDPVYHGARKAFDAAGTGMCARAAGRRRHAGGFIADLPSARAVFLTPSHQFPTGTTGPGSPAGRHSLGAAGAGVDHRR
jgi:GntR family transcriptional regulator/MocR family aminotransferase